MSRRTDVQRAAYVAFAESVHTVTSRQTPQQIAVQCLPRRPPGRPSLGEQHRRVVPSGAGLQIPGWLINCQWLINKLSKNSKNPPLNIFLAVIYDAGTGRSSTCLQLKPPACPFSAWPGPGLVRLGPCRVSPDPPLTDPGRRPARRPSAAAAAAPADGLHWDSDSDSRLPVTPFISV